MHSTIPCTTIQRNGPSAPVTSPEALCSVNLRFRVDGYGEAQATGRGATAQEAASHLRQTIDATRQALAAEGPVAIPPLSRQERLSALLTKGLVCAASRGDMKLVERLSKAAYLVLTDAVVADERPGTWAVRSQRDTALWYSIDEQGQCGCPDAQKHRGDERRYLCKHSLAAALTQRLAE